MKLAPSTTRVLVQLNGAGIGGTELNAVDLASAIRKHGYDSFLVAPRDTANVVPSLRDVVRDRDITLELFDRPRTTMEGARTLRRLAVKYRAELVHVYGSWNSRAAYWGPCFFGRVPLVMTIYEMKVNKDTAAMGAELIVGTRYLLQDINWRRGGVHLISPPVNLEYDQDTWGSERFIFEHGINNAEPKIVIVSRLDEELKAKAVELSMKAVSLNDGKKVQLIVVGSGNAEGRLKELASEINCRHGRRLIHMVGAMSDPRPAYASADIVIGMGGSAARALAFGKPLIVAGEFGWFRIFEHSTADELFRNSFWSDETTADPAGDLNGHIQRLLSDQYDRRALGDFGRRFAQLNFGLEEMATKLVSVYETARRAYDVRAWCSDIPLELGFLSRRFTARRGYRNLALHEPSRGR